MAEDSRTDILNRGGILSALASLLRSENFDGTPRALLTKQNGSSAAAASNVEATDAAGGVGLLPINADRRGATVYNDATAPLYLLLAPGTVAADSFTVKISAGGYYEFPQPVWTGYVQALWEAGAVGAARVTEFE